MLLWISRAKYEAQRAALVELAAQTSELRILKVKEERLTAQWQEQRALLEKYEAAAAGLKTYTEEKLKDANTLGRAITIQLETETRHRITAEAGVTFLREHNAYLLDQINALKEDLKESESRARQERLEAHAERDSLITQIVALSDPGAFLAMERAKMDKANRAEAVRGPVRGVGGLGATATDLEGAVVAKTADGVIIDPRMIAGGIERLAKQNISPLVPAPRNRIYPRSREEMRQEITDPAAIAAAGAAVAGSGTDTPVLEDVPVLDTTTP